MLMFMTTTAKEAECPNDWFKFESSCYQTYPANTYQKAMDKCFWLLNKQKYMKRPYLANIESQNEMDFLMNLMIENRVKEMYIGANNIIKRTNVLSWERLGIADKVDERLLCPDIYVDNESFFCGFIKNMYLENNQKMETDTTVVDTDQVTLDKNPISDTFCVNVSDCFVSLPYLCEVNCTGQEDKCDDWSKEYNSEHGSKTTLLTTTTTSTTTTAYNPCLNNACINNATCEYHLSSKLNYTCKCIIGYEGFFCEKDERPCLPHRNKCKNNSTCNHFYDTRYYNCTCPVGFKGTHCEVNIDDCIEGICQNGGQCEDLINDYRCICTSYFSGEHCQIKNAELEMKENVSRSFSVLAIIFLVFTYLFFISLDALRFIFKIEPESLSQERTMRKKKKLMRKIVEDMKDKKKRKQYRKLIQSVYNRKDPFIQKLEKTFQIAYDIDLRWIDDDSNLDVKYNSD